MKEVPEGESMYGKKLEEEEVYTSELSAIGRYIYIIVADGFLGIIL